MKSESDAIGVGVGMIVVIDTSDVLHREKLEDVAYSHYSLHIGCTANGVCSFGKHKEVRVVGISSQRGIVLFRKVSPNTLKGDVLAQFEFLDKGDAVEELSVEVPGYGPEELSVHEELHVAKHVEGSFLLNI